MDSKKLSDDLRALATVSPGDSKRTKTARMRAVLPDIEAAFEAGATHADVLEKLQAHGLDMTLAVFKTTLRRLRSAGPAKVKVEENFAQSVQPARPASSKLDELGSQPEPVDMESLINHGRKKS